MLMTSAVWALGGTTAVLFKWSTASILVESLVSAMTEKVKEQILAIRDTGETNMFDTDRVQRMAYDRGFYELVLFLEDPKKEYDRFILTGK